MPLLRTTEKIFIGYSQPTAQHKDAAERVIASINNANRHKQIQLYVCEYRRMVVDSLPLQAGIDREIEACDLVILLFGADVGPGLAWETSFTLELLKTGKIYKILPYVFTEHADDEPSSRKSLEVERFYNSNNVLFYKIDRAPAFEDLLMNHIELWLAEEERIVERQRDFLRRGLLRHFAIDDIVFGDDIREIKKRDKDDLSPSPATEEAYRNYVQGSDDMIREEPVHYYLIARHLRDAALRNKHELFSRAEFINPIHQYLAALLRQSDSAVRDKVIAQYEEWLRSRPTLSERTRSFAAFQLGMLQARKSAALLLAVARNHGELKSVRHYAIYALGMLRQRSMIVPLMDLYQDETDAVIRDALVNSILFMMGVTE
ncbi:MAG TPA: HEAT repeat domain-containing protein [Candidatus Angelobacter sp.]|jgi:hypothetical protein|nr:HEAT repeat domain-containing protein [Candidatus Angelobacter sp.]